MTSPPLVHENDSNRPSSESWGRRFSGYIARVHKGVWGAFVLTATPGIGLLDYLTGGEISFSIFYLIPIAVAGWFGSPRVAMASAALAGIVWLGAEMVTHPYSHPIIPYWNAAVRTMFFVLAVKFISFLRQSTTQLNAEVTRQTTALRAEVARRQTLEREVAEFTAQEQARIARDLHDGVGQYLAGMSFQARMLADDLQQAGSPHAAHADRLVEQINRTNRDIRRLDTLLSPPITEAGGLPGALRQLVSDIEEFAGLRCWINVPSAPIGLDPFQALTLFRIAQESLNNAIKHGAAKTVGLELAVFDHELRLRVSDQGRGFPGQGAYAEDGAGLRIMRHRAEVIGATLEIRAGPGHGCVVECSLPLRRPPVNQTEEPA